MRRAFELAEDCGSQTPEIAICCDLVGRVTQQAANTTIPKSVSLCKLFYRSFGSLQWRKGSRERVGLANRQALSRSAVCRNSSAGFSSESKAMMKSIVTLVCITVIGCSSAEQLPSEVPSTTSDALTETEVERIAREAALEVIAEAERDAQRQAEQQQVNATIAKSQPVHEAAIEAESILEARSRRENGYLLLTATERQRVDEIRNRHQEEGLAGFSNRHPDLRWGWYGEGRDALEADLLQAVESPPAEWSEATELFGLEGISLLDFWCADLVEALDRIALAQELRSGGELTDELIRLGREDPLVRPVLIERLKNAQ